MSDPGFPTPARSPSPPVQFPTTGFEILDKETVVEEESWDWYNPEEFYPVRIGEIFNEKYQVVGKLGYGGYGTVWLARDLMEHRFVAVKVGTHEAFEGELKVLQHLRKIKTTHAGTTCLRPLLDEFTVNNQSGTYQCLVHPPLSIDLRTFRRRIYGRTLPAIMLRLILQHLLIAVDMLHTQANVIHTDIQERNILLKMNEATAEEDCRRFMQQELEHPSPRKIDGDRVIYLSRPLVPVIYQYGRPVLCDLGEARFGDYNNMADIQPYQYRAPEVILDIPWDEKVDIWNVGVLAWQLFEGESMFKTAGPDGKDNSMYHLAHMVALLGLPPRDLLSRSKTERWTQWFTEDGTWKAAAPVPDDSLERAEKQLQGEEKAQFLTLIRKMLKWRPEDRSSARELLGDPWMMIETTFTSQWQ